MRISDWSSDVCSSDLQRKCRYRPKVFTHQPILPNNKSHKRVFTPACSSSGRKSHDRSAALPPMMERAGKPGSVPTDDTIELTSPRPPRPSHVAIGDLKNVGAGKSVAVRLDIGGG